MCLGDFALAVKRHTPFVRAALGLFDPVDASERRIVRIRESIRDDVNVCTTSWTQPIVGVRRRFVRLI